MPPMHSQIENAMFGFGKTLSLVHNTNTNQAHANGMAYINLMAEAP